MQKASKRTVVITGTNKGIGFSIVEKLLAGETAYEIISTSRTEKLGHEAVSKLKEKYPSSTSTLIYHQLDVSDSKSVDTFANWLKNTTGKLDVLINNAGISSLAPTEEQKHQIIQTNYLGTVYLTEKLLPLLAADGKVIFVSSTLGSISYQGPTLKAIIEKEGLTEEELNQAAKNAIEVTKDGTQPEAIYPASKAFLNTYIRKFLPNKLKKSQHYFSVCPGLCETDMTSAFLKLENLVLPPGVEVITAEEGADTPVFLTNLPFEKHSELNGLFVHKRQAQVY